MTSTDRSGEETRGILTGIQRFSLHDGPGIRTLVFLKGCPLRCLWCHNPETQTRGVQILYDAGQCIGCGACVGVCPNGCHTVADGRHLFDRSACVACGKCTEVCPSALERCGDEMTVSEVMATVLADAPFYRSGGGLTLSGGEPFCQPEFSLALLREAKARGLHCAVETCGMTAWEHLSAVLPYTDLFLYDIKETDPERHREMTGADNAPILQNLARLSDAGARIVLRVPVIPSENDGDARFAAVGHLAQAHAGVMSVEVLLYHRAGNPKYEKLGRTVREYRVPSREEGADFVARISRFTDKPVKLS